MARKAVLGCEGRAMSAKESTPARRRSLSRSALGILVRLPGFRSSGSSSPPRSPNHTTLPSVRHADAHDTLVPDLVNRYVNAWHFCTLETLTRGYACMAQHYACMPQGHLLAHASMLPFKGLPVRLSCAD